MNKISFEDVINRQREQGNCTLLGLGPMSKNCVDAIIDVGNTKMIPIMLIASRRQIECSDFGGGYVNNWTTEDFSKYVRDKDQYGYTILCRDHGGPWQGDFEVSNGLDLKQAMEAAKKSYEVDISSDFTVIQLDPSIDPRGRVSKADLLDRLFELLDFCVSTANKYDKKIYFEVGTEEVDGSLQEIGEFEDFLTQTRKFCEEQGFDQPVFALGQTGTLLKELENVGTFHTHRDDNQLALQQGHITRLINTCSENGFLLKEHNGDYLEDEILDMHPQLGIHALNVAPQMGVEETREILTICDSLGLHGIKDKFLGLALESRKWEKWLKTDSTANDLEKSIIAGHYVFSKPEFIELKSELSFKARSSGVDLDCQIKKRLTEVIVNFAMRLGLVDFMVPSRPRG